MRLPIDDEEPVELCDIVRAMPDSEIKRRKEELEKLIQDDQTRAMVREEMDFNYHSRTECNNLGIDYVKILHLAQSDVNRVFLYAAYLVLQISPEEIKADIKAQQPL